MATPNANRQSSKKAKSAFARSKLGRWLNAVFCKRSIIIIAEHKTHHIPFSASFQAFACAAVIGFVIWASYSSGSYMAAQRVLEEKDKKLASSTRENMRVAAEFTLLKSDLMKLAAGKGSKSADAAKVLADQYAKAPETVASNDDDAVREQYEAVFKRVEFLDNKVKELQASHDEMMADIRATTGGKIKELEKVIARTGLDEQPLEKAADAKRTQDEQHREKYGRAENAAADGKPIVGGQGGPYIPVPAGQGAALKEHETELYFNLRRMMALNDIVSSLPLDIPLQDHDYVQTSGFGTRTDPFRGTSAYHSGLDLSGHEHAKVVATNDGRVEFAGWKSAYGNVIDIKHGYGISTRYAHLERVLVQPEQEVKKGQVIGIQGSTGRSTGHHLHYEVRVNDEAVNPANFLKAGEDVRSVN